MGETNTLTLTTVTSNEDNRSPWFDILRLKDFPPQILAPKGLYPTWDFGMCINRKPIIADGEVSVAGIGKCTKVPGNEPGTFVPSKDCTIYDHSMISDLVTCYTEKFGVPLSSNGVALSVQFDSGIAEDVVKMTEGNYGIKLTDVKRQNRRDYFNRYKIEKVAEGYTKKLFEHSLNNKRFTWYVGGYAAYESLMKYPITLRSFWSGLVPSRLIKVWSSMRARLKALGNRTKKLEEVTQMPARIRLTGDGSDVLRLSIHLTLRHRIHFFFN